MKIEPMPDRIPLYDVHTLVTGPFKGIGVVDSNEGAASKGQKEWCNVRHREDGRMITVGYDERDLKLASIWRFLFHRNPDGAYQIGNNSLWLWLAAMVGYVFIWRGLEGETIVYAWILRGMCIAGALIYLIYTGRQYMGLTK